MTQQIINTGAVANDGTGESLRAAFDAVNNNFSQVWASGPVDSNVVISGNVVTVLGYNNNLTISGNGIGNIQANSTMVPAQDGVYDLGAVNRRFGSVHGQFFYGNGRFLTGVSGGGSGGGQVTFSNSAPLVANVGDIWIEADTAVQYIYFNDNTSNQWAEMEAYQSFSAGAADLTQVTSNVLPTVNNTYSLGNSSLRWNSVWSQSVTAANVAVTGGFLQLPVYTSNTARNAAISSPASGMIVLVGNTFQGYNGTAWINLNN
jgi:hypothetical protein